MVSMDHEPRAPKSLGEHFGRAIRELNRRRPFSVYLMLAMFVVILLGSQIYYIREDPKRFALFLSLNFAFFLVVTYRAIVDFFDILRSHFREREAVYRETLGDAEFVEELGRSVAKNRGE